MAYTDIDDPTLYFSSTIWTGNATDDRAIVIDGTGMQPDFVWIKSRNDTDNHRLVDSVRGATKHMESDGSGAEQTSSNVKTFTSTGVTLSTNGAVNANSELYASWAWKAGTSFTNDASGTGIGSIDSAGSVSTTAGFSIVSYTGSGSSATIAHALGSKPDIIFTKQRDDNSAAWGGYVSALGATKDIGLNTTGAADADTSYWGDTEPTSTVFTVSSNARSNASGEAYIAYCFTNIKGYSKIGGYTGNGDVLGSYIHLGFKPAFVMVKRTDGGSNYWEIRDNKREPNNPMYFRLFPNINGAESQDANEKIDYVSNGFKLRNTTTGSNGSGNTYIYMAFAENPFVATSGTTAVPVTAR